MRPDNYGNPGKFKVMTNEELQIEFNNWSKLQYYQYSVAASMMLSFILRQIFNMKINSETTNSLVIDQYLYMDIVFSIAAASSQFLV